MSYGTGAGADWVFGDDFLFGGSIPCARELWRRSSYRPGDVDVAQLYDGFTHITISWIEALGLCGIGEFHDWVDERAHHRPRRLDATQHLRRPARCRAVARARASSPRRSRSSAVTSGRSGRSPTHGSRSSPARRVHRRARWSSPVTTERRNERTRNDEQATRRDPRRRGVDVGLRAVRRRGARGLGCRGHQGGGAERRPHPRAHLRRRR